MGPSSTCHAVPGVTWSCLFFQWWQVEKVNPIKLYEENKVIAGFSLLNLLFKQGRAGLIRGVVDRLFELYSQKKIKPVVDSLWALEEVSLRIYSQQIITSIQCCTVQIIRDWLPPTAFLKVGSIGRSYKVTDL